MSDLPSTTADTPRWRFSIRSLLMVVTVICVLLAPYPWLGFWFVLALVYSTLTISLSVASYSRFGMKGLMAVSLLGVVIGYLAGIAVPTPSFGLIAIANVIGSGLCGLLRFQFRRVVSALCLAGVVPYAILFCLGFSEYQRVSELRRQFPPQPLESRLQFQDDTSALAPSIPKLSRDAETNLVSFEQRDQGLAEYRIYTLKLLHDATYCRRTLSYGFAPRSFSRVREQWLTIHERMPFELPFGIDADLTRHPFNNSISEVHSILLEDLFRFERLGWLRDSEHAIGFTPHGPVALQSLLSPGYEDTTEPAWQLTRLELVSLLRHNEPRVYVAETIPLMNELKDIPHRALNEFEASALPQLKTERDTVIDETPDGAVMLGAVRAGNDCLQCHNGPRGRLLGAFSYEFRHLAP